VLSFQGVSGTLMPFIFLRKEVFKNEQFRSKPEQKNDNNNGHQEVDN